MVYSASDMRSKQLTQYADKILIEDTVPANSEKLGKASISSLGHFLSLFITGHFSCSTEVTDLISNKSIIDDGVCHLRGQLVDGTGNRKLFSDYIPLDMFLSPGRVKSITNVNNYKTVLDGSNSTVIATVADKSDNLFLPMEFKYIFAINTDILFYVKNDSNTPVSYAITFHGFRLMDKKTTVVHKY
jgi:hypothetical protein